MVSAQERTQPQLRDLTTQVSQKVAMSGGRNAQAAGAASVRTMLNIRGSLASANGHTSKQSTGHALVARQLRLDRMVAIPICLMNVNGRQHRLERVETELVITRGRLAYQPQTNQLQVCRVQV